MNLSQILCVVDNKLRTFVLFALTAVLLALFGALVGCLGDNAHAVFTNGSQLIVWGLFYSNMLDIVLFNVRLFEYAVVAVRESGLLIDFVKGYWIEHFGGGVYMVIEGVYQVMLVVLDVGVIVVDVSLTIGLKLLSVVQDVVLGAKIVVLFYSYAYIDYIGYVGEIVKTNSSMVIVVHEEMRKLLQRAQDFVCPLFTQIFDMQDVDFLFVVGNQMLQFQYLGFNHEFGNIGIYHVGSKVLMLVDVIYLGWMMWCCFGVSHDIPGYFNFVKTMNTCWDFDTLIAGYVGCVGMKVDVMIQLEFMIDLHVVVYEGFGMVRFGEMVSLKDLFNVWVFFCDYVDCVMNYCVNKVSQKWGNRLAAFDVWIYDQCVAMEQSLRIDGLSLK